MQVLFALLGRVPPTQKAQLSGYHRYQIRDHVFPAIRPKEGNSVAGLFMEGLDARERVRVGYIPGGSWGYLGARTYGGVID